MISNPEQLLHTEGAHHAFAIETVGVPLTSDGIVLPSHLEGLVQAKFTIDPPVPLNDPHFSETAQIGLRGLRYRDGNPHASAVVQLTTVRGSVDVYGQTHGRVLTTRWDADSARRFAGVLRVVDEYTAAKTWRTNWDEGPFSSELA